jgi:hypothetical protein
MMIKKTNACVIWKNRVSKFKRKIPPQANIDYCLFSSNNKIFWGLTPRAPLNNFALNELNVDSDIPLPTVTLKLYLSSLIHLSIPSRALAPPLF